MRSSYLAYVVLCVLIFSCQPDPYRQGRVLYEVHCSNCHMEDGSGLSKLIPSLAQTEVIMSDPSLLVCLIRKGLPRNAATNQQMPPNTILNDVEITNLINYLRNLYLPEAAAVKVIDVSKHLEECS